jgi:tetratricopeptide (TPR) repeat protein
MELTKEQYEEMVAYFEGRMQPAEEWAFLEALAAHPALQEAFDQELLLRTAAGSGGIDHPQSALSLPPQEWDTADEHLRKVIAAARKQTGDDTKKAGLGFIQQYWVVLSIAASLLLVISFIIYVLVRRTDAPELVHQPTKQQPVPIPIKDTAEKQVLLKQHKPDDGQLAMNAFKKFHQIYLPSDDDPVQVSKIVIFYQQKDFIRALHELGTDSFGVRSGETEQEKQRVKQYALFYRGLCYLEMKQERKALPIFQQLSRQLTTANPLYAEVAWHSAMAFLATGSKDEAIRLLRNTDFSKTPGDYAKRAKQIIRYLEREGK